MGKEVQGEIPIVRTETAKGLQQALGINVLKRILQNCCKQICKIAIFGNYRNFSENLGIRAEG